jgi:hypothetical protein
MRKAVRDALENFIASHEVIPLPNESHKLRVGAATIKKDLFHQTWPLGATGAAGR